MNAKLVPIQFPRNLEEMIESFGESSKENVGWCLLCDQPIRTASDMIPGTNTHNCLPGRESESQVSGINS